MYRRALLSALFSATVFNSEAKPLAESITQAGSEVDIREIPYHYKIIVEWNSNSSPAVSRAQRLRSTVTEGDVSYLSLLPSQSLKSPHNGDSEFNMYSVQRLLKKYHNGRFFENVSAAVIPELADLSSEILLVHRLNALGLDMIIIKDDEHAEDILNKLKALPSVKLAELDSPMPREDDPEVELNLESGPEANDAPAGPTREVPSDPMFKSLWGMDSKLDFDINAPEMWAYMNQRSYKNDKDASVLVAVLDTGSLINHIDLSEQLWTNPGEIPGNGIDDDGNGYVDDVHGWNFVEYKNSPNDDHMHGSHCAGTIAGTGDNKKGVAGVWWNSKIMSLKILSAQGGGPYSASISALNYAVGMGAQITSNSWGGYDPSMSLKTAFTNSPMLHIIAAGNANLNIDIDHEYPAYFSKDVPQVVTIAALKYDGTLAKFSNYGKGSVDFAAPGVEILSTCLNNTYCLASGTSMATPHVAGIAAAVFARGSRIATEAGFTKEQVGPYPEDLKDALTSSVKKIPSLAGKLKHAGTADALAAVKAIEVIMKNRIQKYKAGIQVFKTGTGVPIDVYLHALGGTSEIDALSGTCPSAEWTPWTRCSTDCGAGIQTRIKLVYPENSGCNKSKAALEFDSQACYVSECSASGSWWSKVLNFFRVGN